jgi:hypothetical protein
MPRPALSLPDLHRQRSVETIPEAPQAPQCLNGSAALVRHKPPPPVLLVRWEKTATRCAACSTVAPPAPPTRTVRGSSQSFWPPPCALTRPLSPPLLLIAVAEEATRARPFATHTRAAPLLGIRPPFLRLHHFCMLGPRCLARLPGRARLCPALPRKKAKGGFSCPTAPVSSNGADPRRSGA